MKKRIAIVVFVLFCSGQLAVAASADERLATYTVVFRGNYDPLTENPRLWGGFGLHHDESSPGNSFTASIPDERLSDALSAGGVVAIMSNSGRKSFFGNACPTSDAILGEYAVNLNDMENSKPVERLSLLPGVRVSPGIFAKRTAVMTIPQKYLASVFLDRSVTKVVGRCMAKATECSRVRSKRTWVRLSQLFLVTQPVLIRQKLENIVREYGLADVEYHELSFTALIAEKTRSRLRKDPRISELGQDCQSFSLQKFSDGCTERVADEYIVTLTHGSNEGANVATQALELQHKVRLIPKALGPGVYVAIVPKEHLAGFVADPRVARVEANCVGSLF